LLQGEISRPISQLALNLELVGNYFSNQTQFLFAQKALERACPLLDLLAHDAALNCLQTLQSLYRLTPTFPDDETIVAHTKKLLDPYQHLKIEFWLKNFIETREEHFADPGVLVRQFLSQFKSNELLHRISLISQNLFSELLVRVPLNFLDDLPRGQWRRPNSAVGRESVGCNPSTHLGREDVSNPSASLSPQAEHLWYAPHDLP
jgi:hypothetical protein